jgi:hypothetical protein
MKHAAVSIPLLAFAIACHGGDAGDGADASPRADAGSRADAGRPAPDARDGAFAPPPANGALDYQLGGAYSPRDEVVIVSRDRTDAPAPGIYNICYVNGYQAQPDDDQFWLTTHPELVLRDARGEPVIDPDWNELLLDPTTPDKRTQLASIVGDSIAACAADGFDAVEIDNLDTYARSGGLIAADDAVAYLRLLSDRAHAAGLAIAQKNAAEISGRRVEMGTDFAVAEECNRYGECSDYADVYGDAVLVIEYRRADFDAGCRDFPGLSIVLRDLELTTPGSAAYVYDGC